MFDFPFTVRYRTLNGMAPLAVDPEIPAPCFGKEDSAENRKLVYPNLDGFVKSRVRPSIYIRANAFESPQLPDFPFTVMYRTMNGKQVDDFLRVHQPCKTSEYFSMI
jgi:hypothetical protein